MDANAEIVVDMSKLIATNGRDASLVKEHFGELVQWFENQSTSPATLTPGE
jgi:hypothetical protein